MFSRRHPYLFSLIIMGTLSVAGLTLLTIMVSAIGDEEVEYTGEKVGVIEIVGPITESREILSQIKKFREAKAIKAILVRIDSPGGGVGPSQEIYREICKTVEQKKVVVSMGAVAASGGYYVAAAANGIMANPGTITGSIGVVMGYTNFEDLMRKIGLTPVVIKSGEYKDMGSPARQMTAAEKDLLKGVTLQIHGQFVNAIATGRQLEVQQVESIADGRIFTGEEAKNKGLVDRLGNFEDAIEWAGELGGIKGEVNTVYPKPQKLSILRQIMESALHLWSESQLHTRVSPQLSIPQRIGAPNY